MLMVLDDASAQQLIKSRDSHDDERCESRAGDVALRAIKRPRTSGAVTYDNVVGT
jgi:hypothetical protein